MNNITDEKSFDEYYRKKYWVIFEQSRLKNWWIRMLEKNFRHVCIARVSDGKQFWIVNDSIGGNLLTTIYPICDIRKLYPDAVIMERWSIPQKEPANRIWHLNCVEFVKLVLGIRRCYILTPYQLYKFIKEEYHGKQETKKR
jgi:hypothetical protein